MWEDDDDLDLSNIEFGSCGVEDAAWAKKKPNSALPALLSENCSRSTAAASVFLDKNKKLKLSNIETNFMESFQANQVTNMKLSNATNHHASKSSTCSEANNSKGFGNTTSSVSMFARQHTVQHKKVPSFLCNRDDSDLDLNLSQWEPTIASNNSGAKRTNANPRLVQHMKIRTNHDESSDSVQRYSLDQHNVSSSTCNKQTNNCAVNKNDYLRVPFPVSSPSTPPDEQFSFAVNKCCSVRTGFPELTKQPPSSALEVPTESMPPDCSTAPASVTTILKQNNLLTDSTATKVVSVRNQTLTSPLFFTPVHSRPSRQSGSVRKRRFPGPAGLLPQLQGDQAIKLSELSGETENPLASPNSVSHYSNVEVPSSQNSEDDFFVRSTWLTMEEQLGLNQENQSCSLTKYSIAWLIRKANAKQLPVGKMPFLASIIKSLIIKGIDACVVLRDKTGEIVGTIHRQLLEEFSDVMQVGSVLVLKQIGIFSPANRRHYLNITRQNVLCIYSIQEDGSITSNKLFVGSWCHVAKEVEEFSSRSRAVETSFMVASANSRPPSPFVKNAVVGPCVSSRRIPAIQKMVTSQATQINSSSSTTQQKTNNNLGPTEGLISQHRVFSSVNYSKVQQTTEIHSDESSTIGAQCSSVTARQNFTFKPVDSLRNRRANLLSPTPDNQKSSQLTIMHTNSSSYSASSKEVISWQEDDLDKLLEEMSEEELLLGSGFVTS